MLKQCILASWIEYGNNDIPNIYILIGEMYVIASALFG